MDAIDNIRGSLLEIDLLLNYAKRNAENIHKYQLFLKVSSVLLSTKLEAFLEDFFEEHSERVINGHTNATFPENLRDLYFDRGVELLCNERDKNKRDALLKSIMHLHKNSGDDLALVRNIKPSVSFNYGKHGQKEIENLFKKHGMMDFIFSQDSQECLKMLNSLIAIRNNVIHQDASPSITHQTIIDHKNNICRFLLLLEAEVEQNKQMYYNEVV